MKNFLVGTLALFLGTVLVGCEGLDQIEVNLIENEAEKISEEEITIENELNEMEPLNLETKDSLDELESESEKISQEETSIENELNELENLEF